jgi:hypothetical protein
MKIIFLDIDGVICVDDSDFVYFNADCCDRVNKIIDATGAYIVVSSSWRCHHDSLESLMGLMSRGYETPFLQFIIDFNIIGTFKPERIIGMTPHYRGVEEKGKPYGRGVEISMWLADHPEVTSYVVLDDEYSDLITHKTRLVRTDSYFGISDEDVITAIGILNKAL